MKKKIIFLDGDGTIWYPTKTKRSEKPHWVYDHPDTKDNHLEHLELTPDVEKVIKELQNRGILLVVISANPREESVAVEEIKTRIKHFNLQDNFLLVRSSSGDDPNGKGKIILEVLKDLNLEKEDALMIGDSYFYDYLAAKNVGVDALWIENSVSKIPDILPDDFRKINEVSGVLNLLD
jgi:HAD superfamily hydrolase (TIGR01662 family)